MSTLKPNPGKAERYERPFDSDSYGVSDFRKTPFPYFGGKRHAAPYIWEALGDVPHYVEPFFGGGAVLLHRPHKANRQNYVETVNDLDGAVCNFFRSVQMHPQETAEAASWPTIEADKHARQVALLKWRDENQLEHLMGDPKFCDPEMAGWWAWSMCLQIGVFGAGGPWWPDDTGRLRKQERGVERENGITRQVPFLGHGGRGVAQVGLREKGVGHTRSTEYQRDLLERDPREAEVDWHPMTMPALRNWFGFLSARLRHVRILNGDWSRCLGNGALYTQPVRMGVGPAGVFLDPPYVLEERATVYTHDEPGIADDVRKWCLENGDDPRLRIVLAGFETEHAMLEDHGWRVVEWYSKGFMRGGMGNIGGAENTQMDRDRLWMSPHCLNPHEDPQIGLF